MTVTASTPVAGAIRHTRCARRTTLNKCNHKPINLRRDRSRRRIKQGDEYVHNYSDTCGDFRGDRPGEKRKGFNPLYSRRTAGDFNPQTDPHTYRQQVFPQTRSLGEEHRTRRISPLGQDLLKLFARRQYE